MASGEFLWSADGAPYEGKSLKHNPLAVPIRFTVFHCRSCDQADDPNPATHGFAAAGQGLFARFSGFSVFKDLSSG